MSSTQLDHYELWSHLLGGLALFLFGMDFLTRALKRVAGDRMRFILERLTKNRIVGALTGAIVTAIINSSSVTTVILVGFISAGLLSLSQAVSVIMGANIGSTVTAQILAFKVSKIALPLVALGFLLWFLPRRDRVRSYGATLLGLGLVFYGMSVMSEAMAPLRAHQPFLDLMTHLDHQFLAVLIGALFTAVIQSSAATTGIVIVMSGSGLLTVNAAIAVALGANIGTCATALIASVGKPREAVRAAVVHVLFNVLGVLLWVWFVPELGRVAAFFTPGGQASLDAVASAPRLIANAHTIFNVVNTLLFIGLSSQFARFAEWLIPDPPIEESLVIQPRFLDENLLTTPSFALDRARREIHRLGRKTLDMFDAILPALLHGDRDELNSIAAMDRTVDVLHAAVIDYLRHVGQGEITEQQGRSLVDLMDIANSFEAIGDVIEVDLVRIGDRRARRSFAISPETQTLIRDYHAVVRQAMAASVDSLEGPDRAPAQRVVALRETIGELTAAAADHGAQRLIADEPNRLDTYKREMETIERLERVYFFARRIARVVLHFHGNGGLPIADDGAGEGPPSAAERPSSRAASPETPVD